jgi:hypothetical protein
VITDDDDLEAEVEELTVEGGWVLALGQGSLSDARSRLHRRDRIGIQRHGAYFSVDTGKYSVAPRLAQHVVAEIVRD